MSPEQKRQPVYVYNSDTGHITTSGLIRAEADPPDEPVRLLHEDAQVIPAGSFHLAQLLATQAAPTRPADSMAW